MKNSAALSQVTINLNFVVLKQNHDKFESVVSILTFIIGLAALLKLMVWCQIKLNRLLKQTKSIHFYQFHKYAKKIDL